MRTIRWIGIIAVVAATGCADAPLTVLDRLLEARRLSAELLVQFTKAADATNRAVMARTETAPTEYVREANEATNAVQSTIDQLRPILAALRYAKESQLLDEFSDRFGTYRELDRSILEMVVDSSNLKAQRLSFGPAQQEADALRDALQPVPPLTPVTKRASVEALVATAVLSVRETQALQAPHIAEPDGEEMTRIEKRMTASAAAARHALATLAGIVPSAGKANIATASAALDRFMSLNAEILTLSRRNSNVHALALSLGQKRTIVAACEESLRALQDALANRGFPGAR